MNHLSVMDCTNRDMLAHVTSSSSSYEAQTGSSGSDLPHFLHNDLVHFSGDVRELLFVARKAMEGAFMCQCEASRVELDGFCFAVVFDRDYTQKENPPPPPPPPQHTHTPSSEVLKIFKDNHKTRRAS